MTLNPNKEEVGVERRYKNNVFHLYHQIQIPAMFSCTGLFPAASPIPSVASHQSIIWAAAEGNFQIQFGRILCPASPIPPCLKYADSSWIKSQNLISLCLASHFLILQPLFTPLPLAPTLASLTFFQAPRLARSCLAYAPVQSFSTPLHAHAPDPLNFYPSFRPKSKIDAFVSHFPGASSIPS